MHSAPIRTDVTFGAQYMRFSIFSRSHAPVVVPIVLGVSNAAVRVYSTLICPYCIRAKLLLRQRGIPYTDINVTGDRTARAQLVEMTGRRTVPQIFIGEESIGGFDELRALDRSGELERKLRVVAPGVPQAQATV
jgi:glutaredoxin 3